MHNWDDPSARTSQRPTLSQLVPRAWVRAFCVPYFTQNIPTPRAPLWRSGFARETAPAPKIDTAAPGMHVPRPLHTRADALTRQLPRAAAQQLSEQSTSGWWAGHRRRLLASCCAGACERRGTVRAGISPDSSVGLPVNPRSRAVVLVAGRWRRVRGESQRRGGTKTLTKRHQPQPTHPPPSTRPLPARFRPLGVGGAILTQPQHGH